MGKLNFQSCLEAKLGGRHMQTFGRRDSTRQVNVLRRVSNGLQACVGKWRRKEPFAFSEQPSGVRSTMEKRIDIVNRACGFYEPMSIGCSRGGRNQGGIDMALKANDRRFCKVVHTENGRTWTRRIHTMMVQTANGRRYGVLTPDAT